MFGIGPGEENGVNATLAGIQYPDPKTNQLADRVISQDALVKLRLVRALGFIASSLPRVAACPAQRC
jgi:hypothetical protein